jgi:hypothetical protein
MKLDEQLRVLRAKDQKITVKDGQTVLIDKGTKNDVTYGILGRDVFSTIIEEDGSITISLVNRDAIKKK